MLNLELKMHQPHDIPEPQSTGGPLTSNPRHAQGKDAIERLLGVSTQPKF